MIQKQTHDGIMTGLRSCVQWSPTYGDEDRKCSHEQILFCFQYSPVQLSPKSGFAPSSINFRTKSKSPAPEAVNKSIVKTRTIFVFLAIQ